MATLLVPSKNTVYVLCRCRCPKSSLRLLNLYFSYAILIKSRNIGHVQTKHWQSIYVEETQPVHVKVHR